MTLQLLIDSVEYPQKPTGGEIGIISKRIALQPPQSLTPSELADCVERGLTFCPSTFHIPFRKDEYFKQSGLLCLDFDRGLPQNIQQWAPNLVYQSFSWTPESPRYRAVWFLSETINELTLYRAAIKWLMRQFPTSDQSTKDSCRLFFGSTPNSVVSIEDSLRLELPPEATRAPKVPKASRSRAVSDSESLEEQRNVLYRLRRGTPADRRRFKELSLDLTRSLNDIKEYRGNIPGRSRYQLLWNVTADSYRLEEDDE